MSSKLDTYNVFKYGLKASLPSYRYCNLDFLRQLLFGSKKYIKKANIRVVDVPKWAEFKAKDFYKTVIQDKRFKDYLPDLSE